MDGQANGANFRPLSWGLSFNDGASFFKAEIGIFSSPFLGTFFQLDGISPFIYAGRGFSSPFLGTFFQLLLKNRVTLETSSEFSSPFLGTFFQ